MGMPSGTTSSVYAWHRVGNLLAWIQLTVAKAPVGRYVDVFSERLGTVSAGRGDAFWIFLASLSAFRCIRGRAWMPPN